MNRPTSRAHSLVAFGIFLALAVLVFDRGIIGQSASMYIGRETDPPTFMWFFKWWLYALTHHLNPFISYVVWAPRGINLAWTTFVPLPALISFPLQLTIGEPGAYNFIVTFMPPLAALSAFFLCRRITGQFWPSILGGYIFGFSPYILGEVLGHLVLIAVFPVPLIALITLKRLDGGISAARFAVILAALLVIQFLCSVELFATITLVGGFSLMLALVLFRGDLRIRLRRLIIPIIGGYSISTAVLSPYFYYLLAFGHPSGPIWTPSRYCADLIGFVVPRHTVWWGSADFATRISSLFHGNIMENGEYLGVVLIVFIEIFRRRFWSTSAGRFLTILFFAIILAAIGPTLHIAGVEGFPMPWALFQRLPLIENILPVRFMMYAFLVVAVMVAILFASWSARRVVKCAAAAVIVISIAPNPSSAFWVTQLDIPAFFTDGAYHKVLAPGEIVMPFPLGLEGDSMYWQLKSNMYFRMAGGWTGVAPFEFDRMPIMNYSHGAIDLPEAADQLKSYVAAFGVQAVIVDARDPRLPVWQPMLDGLGVPAQQVDGARIYKIPDGAFAEYRTLNAASVEARAVALRFDTIIEAAAKYLAAGQDPAILSPLELKRHGLLPRDWIIETGALAVKDWAISSLADHTIAIVVLGSYDGVKPLIDRYGGSASEIRYPQFKKWTPGSTPPKDTVKSLLMTFDRDHLMAVAKELQTSPPPERTTSFIAGVSGWQRSRQ